MAARSSGSRVVSIAIAGTVAAVGVGTIYLPFFADKDKLRGLHEEEAAPTAAMLVLETKKLEAAGLLRGDEPDEKQEAKQQPKRSAGSMWQSFRK
jgi:flagellar basal body-associated protein FliL